MARLQFASNVWTYFPTPDLVLNDLIAYVLRQATVYSASSAALVAGSGTRSGPKKPSTIGNSWCGCNAMLAPLAAFCRTTMGAFGTTVFTPMSM